MKNVLVDACPPKYDPVLIRRVNQLYHELRRGVFDAEHRYRHRVEGGFWKTVARLALGSGRQGGSAVVVDLACGTGFVGRLFRPHLGPDDHLLAIDLSEGTVQTARAQYGTKGDIGLTTRPLLPLAGDGQALPLADGCVDLLAINASLHHLPDPPAVLGEIDRVLKPLGYFALGFEPNRAHFAQPLMAGLDRGLERMSWYAGPRRNWRRLCRWGGRTNGGRGRGEPADDCFWAETINRQLIHDGLIEQPLSRDYLLDLVDPHARGARGHVGFEPVDLLRRAMPHYQVHLLQFSDYLGPSVRQLPAARALVDVVLRRVCPRQGVALFLADPQRRRAGRALTRTLCCGG